MLKNTTAFDPQNPNAFSYDAQAIDIERKKRLAAAMQEYEMRRGGITNAGGFYAGGPNWGDVVAKAFTAYLGGKGKYDADEKQKELDAASRDAYRYGYNQLTTPSEAETRPLSQEAIYNYPKPEMVGPPSETEATPVRPQPQISGQPLPQQALGGAMAARQGGSIARPTQQAGPTPTGPSPEMLAYQQATEQGPSQVINKEALAQAMAAKEQAGRDRRVNAIDTLYASGPRGQGLANAMQAAEMARLAKGKGEDEFAMSDGVIYNKRTGETKQIGNNSKDAKQALDQNEFVLKVRKEIVPLEQQITDSSSALEKIDRFMALNSKYNAHGGVISSAVGSIGKAFGSDAANEYDMASKDVKASLLKQVFGGSPTEGERQYLDQVFGAYSAGKVPTERAMQQLREAVTARLNTNKQLVGEFRNMLPSASPPSSGSATQPASKSGLDWMPAR